MTAWTVRHPGRYAFGEVRRLRVQVMRGSVSVVGGEGQPRLEVLDLNGDLPLLVRHEHGELTLRHVRTWPGLLGWLRDLRPRRLLARLRRRLPWHGGWRQAEAVHLSLVLPRDCEVAVESAAASVVVSGIRAPVTARSVNGEVTLMELAGRVNAETVSGPLSGHGLHGDLYAGSVSGRVTLGGVTGGTVQAHNVSGPITVDLDSPMPGRVRATSVSGRITLRLPAQPDAAVALHAVSRRIINAFDELAEERLPGSHTVQGVLGAGGGLVWASTTSGRIALLRRGPAAAGEPGPPGRGGRGPSGAP